MPVGEKNIADVSTTLSSESSGLLNPVVDALKRSPEAVTFIPSRYGGRFSADDFKEVQGLEQVSGYMDAIEGYAKEAGVGITPVLAGTYHDYFFNYS